MFDWSTASTVSGVFLIQYNNFIGINTDGNGAALKIIGGSGSSPSPANMKIWDNVFKDNVGSKYN
jgi:hypothetical protein